MSTQNKSGRQLACGLVWKITEHFSGFWAPFLNRASEFFRSIGVKAQAKHLFGVLSSSAIETKTASRCDVPSLSSTPDHCSTSFRYLWWLLYVCLPPSSSQTQKRHHESWWASWEATSTQCGTGSHSSGQPGLTWARAVGHRIGRKKR